MFFIQKVILLITVNAFCALLVLAFACWHVNMLTSMLECICMCASYKMACAFLHEACQHHAKTMSKVLDPRSWSIGESSAREARAKILVYIYIYICISLYLNAVRS